MEPKTLHSVVKEICQAFVGPKIDKDLGRLRELHTGLLRIDLLTGQCYLDESKIDPLEIASELQKMLEPQLTKIGVRTEDVVNADLVTRFSAKEGAVQASNALRLECSGRIEAFGRDYVAREVSERTLA